VLEEMKWDDRKPSMGLRDSMKVRGEFLWLTWVGLRCKINLESEKSSRKGVVVLER
jgi:hypothetical protein